MYAKQRTIRRSQFLRNGLNGWMTHQFSFASVFATHARSSACTFSSAMGSPKRKM